MKIHLSNAMWFLWLAATGEKSPTTAPTTAPAVPPSSEAADYTQCTLIIIGVIFLLIWVIRRAFRPKKLSLIDTPGRPSGLTPLHVIPLFLFWMMVVASAKTLLLNYTSLSDEYAGLLGGILGQLVSLPVLLVMGQIMFRHGLRRGMGLSLRHWGFDSLRGIYAVLAVFPVCVGLALLFSMLLFLIHPDWVEPHSHLVLLEKVSAGWKTMVILAAVILAPLVEELLFRGFLQSMLRRYLQSPWLAMTLTAAIFAMFHFQTPQNVPALFVLGMVLGYNYERCGRLYPPILIHVLFNGIFILLQLL